MVRLRPGQLSSWEEKLSERYRLLDGRKPRSVVSVCDWAVLFLVHMKRVGYQPRTIASYFYFLRRLWQWCEETGRSRMRHIQRDDMVAFLHYRIDECNVSRRWIRLDRHRLCVFFGFLQQQEVIRGSNPASGIGFYRQDHPPPREVLSQEECSKLVRAPQRELDEALSRGALPTPEQRIRVHRAAAILALMIGSGLRRTEVTELTLEATDLDRGLLRVRGKGRQQLFRVERDVFVHPVALREIRAYLSLTGRRKAGTVFLSLDGRYPLGSSAVGALPVHYGPVAIGRRVTAHLLRHTFATHVIRRGADIHTAQRLLGHKDPATTLKYYLHLAPEDIREEWKRTCPVRGASR